MPGATVLMRTPAGAASMAAQAVKCSNAAFDASLRAGNPASGLRDVEAVHALAATAGLQLVEDRAMPANNRCITWQRHADKF